MILMNKNYIKSIVSMALVITVLFSNGITVDAAGKKATKNKKAKVTTEASAYSLNSETVEKVFDAEYYAKTYPDVVAVVGTDAKKLFNHYVTCGVDEGRDASATFNLDAYASANPDLLKLFGAKSANRINYFKHFVNSGMAENRVATIAAATKAGITVKSLMDDTKVIAAPVAGAPQVANYSHSSGSSNNGSSNSGSSSNNTQSAPTVSAPSTSAPASNSASTPAAQPTNTETLIPVSVEDVPGYNSNSNAVAPTAETWVSINGGDWVKVDYSDSDVHVY
jgi:hypothetical protein